MARIARRFKKEKALQIVDLQGFQVVEVVGFEPTAFWSRTISRTDKNPLYYNGFRASCGI
jgi:uncharacterized protein YcgI (DUF1989 family)